MPPLTVMPGQPVNPPCAPVEALAAAPAPRGLSAFNKVRRLLERPDTPRWKRRDDGGVEWIGRAEYVVKLRNAQGLALEINTRQARQLRAYKRVKAWAAAIRNWGKFERPTPETERDPATWYQPRGQQARLVMVTLTYAQATAWRPGQVREFMLALRRRYKDGILAYAWALETQKRGAPHYHVLLLLKPAVWLDKPDESGIWRYGSTNIVQARSPYYIVCYVGKGYQKTNLPKGARMFAVWIAPAIVPMNTRKRFEFRCSATPAWLAEILDRLAFRLVRWALRWTRQKGGGWLLRDTGEVVHSGFAVESVERLT